MTELGPPEGWGGHPEQPGGVGVALEGRPPNRAWMRAAVAEDDELGHRRLLDAARSWAGHLRGYGLLMQEGGRFRRDGEWLVLDTPLELIP